MCALFSFIGVFCRIFAQKNKKWIGLLSLALLALMRSPLLLIAAAFFD